MGRSILRSEMDLLDVHGRCRPGPMQDAQDVESALEAKSRKLSLGHLCKHQKSWLKEVCK